MKAKEYAYRLRNADDKKKELIKILFDLIMESKELMKVRHISTNAGLFGVIKELDQKWQAIVTLCQDILKPEAKMAFRRVLCREFGPELIVPMFKDLGWEGYDYIKLHE